MLVLILCDYVAQNQHQHYFFKEHMPKSDQGAVPGRYTIIPRTLVFVFRGEEVLLIKGAPTKRLWANRYNGIGGHIERGEDALSAARRELEEETGLEHVDLRLVGTVLVDASDQLGIGLYVFKGEYRSGALTPSTEGQLEWVPLDRLDALPLVEDLQVFLPRICQMQAEDGPFCARTYYDENDQMKIIFGE